MFTNAAVIEGTGGDPESLTFPASSVTPTPTVPSVTPGQVMATASTALAVAEVGAAALFAGGIGYGLYHWLGKKK